MKTKRVNKGYCRGFSLIEIALALFLIGIFLASVLTITGGLRGVDKKRNQAEAMLDVHQAMLVYLKVNGHLPCPDTDGDGKENRKIKSGVSVCTRRSGELPYLDLSLPGKDEWNNAYYYQVNARSESNKFVNDMCQTASIFGMQGNRTVDKNLAYCPSSHIYYCHGCSDVCSSTCVTSKKLDLSGLQTPPYLQLGTPPVGVDKEGDVTNSHKNLWLEDLSGNEIENALVYMVVSFGVDGSATWSKCQSAATSRQQENCDGDELFSETEGSSQDFLDGMSVLEVKQALLDIGVIK